jgi:polyhydroxyalkanoate synthase
MTVAGTDPLAIGTEAMRHAGQEIARSLQDYLAVSAAPGEAARPLQIPDAETLGALQREFTARHAELWSAMMRSSGAARPDMLVRPAPGDRRFSSPEWAAGVHFDYLRQAYLLNAEFVRRITDLIPAGDEPAKVKLQFLARQFIDAVAPSNFVATNPEVIQEALRTQGASLAAGVRNMIEDLDKGRISMTDESAFEIGRNLAVTPGAVVFENELIQLIQYSPLTDSVARRPFLIVPACINKFYILDLQPENSFVRYAVERGHTVFLISWRNVQADRGHLTWDDYLEQGPLAAFRVVREICSVADVNALGFCIGGTLLAAALSVAAARGDRPAASLTLLTTLLDFSDTGEIGCFIDAQAVAARDTEIGKGGLLRGRELMNAFSSLRANDLVWQYLVGNYMMGRKPEAFDILYWNSDCTNLPGPFVTYYLRHTYLKNDLRTPGKLRFCDASCDLGRLDVPAFLYASREDHLVPWTGAYLSRQVLGAPTTFVLGASGHIAGVINPPAKNRRSYWTNEAEVANADQWFRGATQHKGSWWPYWSAWLDRYRDGDVPARGRVGSTEHPALEPAPGRYVRQRA